MRFVTYSPMLHGAAGRSALWGSLWLWTGSLQRDK